MFRLSIHLGLSLMMVASMSAFGADFAPFFEGHCVKCHGPDKQKGGLRLDNLATPTDANAETWLSILDVIESGDMPPKKEPRPGEQATQQLLSWLDEELIRIAEPIPGLRRMNRAEYEATVHDLFGIDASLAEFLPEDSEVQGFDNVATGLGISSILMERYLEAANAAFDATIRRIKPLPLETRRSVLMEQKENQSSTKKGSGGVKEVAGSFVDPSPRWAAPRMDDARPIEDGVYKCRIAVWPNDPGERTLAAGVFVGPMFATGNRRFMGIYDVTGTPEEPRVIEFTTFLAAGETIHVLPWIYPNYVSWIDKNQPAPGVAIVWAETHGPLDQSFPGEAQKRLFGDLKTITMMEGPSVYNRHRRGLRSHFVESSAPREDAERIIREFAPRAFRRPVDDVLVDQFVQLTLSRLDEGATFEQAVRTGVTAVLCSPHFLLINREPKVDDYTIASRLSYFFWSSMPDEELLRLAAEGKLNDPKTRHAQVERMLADARSERFIDNFIGQWLDLRDIEFTTPDAKLYPEYDDLLLQSMLGETRGFFQQLLEDDMSVTNFIDSDFAILNQRMAAHYGIPGVVGHERFRRVQLPDDHVRGGILTHASVLKVTANGTTTSPVLRGVWVLENVLGIPPPPPPAGVPAVEPDIRGATSIREQLAKHSADASCARCHAKIDPPGFALEEFDAIGQQRNFYRVLGGEGKRGPRKAAWQFGPDLETGGVTADGQAFANFVEFRRQLLEHPEIVARAVAEKLLIYGTGRPLTHADEASIDAIVEASSEHNFGLRSMIHAVVETELFHRP